MTKNNQEQELSSLAEIMLRKELVQKDIDADDEKIKTLWNSLFKKPDALSKSASTSKRISSLMSMGAGALDGAILNGKAVYENVALLKLQDAAAGLYGRGLACAVVADKSVDIARVYLKTQVVYDGLVVIQLAEMSDFKHLLLLLFTRG